MGSKAAETIRNINKAFGQELLMNVQGSGGSRSFAKETRALKIRAQWPATEVDNDRLRAIIEADHTTTQESCLRTQR